MLQNSSSESSHNHNSTKATTLLERFARDSPTLDPTSAKYVTEVVAYILRAAIAAKASDIHFAVSINELQVLSH